MTGAVGHPASRMTAQNRTTALSTDSVHRVVDGATHQAMLDDQQYAARTCRAVLDVVSSVRNHQPLTSNAGR